MVENKGNPKKKKRTAWVAFIDIYGFRGLLFDENLSKVSQELNAFHTRVHQFLNLPHDQSPSNHLKVASASFSDSFVLAVDAEPQDNIALQCFIERLSKIIKAGAEQGFLFRGAAAFGNVVSGPYHILGEAYLRAYRYESEILQGPIVVIPKSEFARARLEQQYVSEFTELVVKDGSVETVLELSHADWEQAHKIARENLARISQMPAGETKTRLEVIWATVMEKRSSA
jgi:hypothetical protein